MLEGGIVGPPGSSRDGSLPVSTNEMRAAFGAPMLTDIVDIFLYAQGGFFDYGVLGAGQIDRFGNINSSIIGDHDHPTVGSWLGARTTSPRCATVADRHVARDLEVRREGRLRHQSWVAEWRHCSLRLRAPTRRSIGGVTELAVFDFHPVTREMRLCALQQGASTRFVPGPGSL